MIPSRRVCSWGSGSSPRRRSRSSSRASAASAPSRPDTRRSEYGNRGGTHRRDGTRPRARLPRILRRLHAGRPRRAGSYRGRSAAPDRYYGAPNATYADDPAAPRYAARRGSSTVRLPGQRSPAGATSDRGRFVMCAYPYAFERTCARDFNDPRCRHSQATERQPHTMSAAREEE